MKSITDRAGSRRIAIFGLVVLSLFTAALLNKCVGDWGSSLKTINFPKTEAGFIEAAGKGDLAAVRMIVDGGMKVAGADSPGQKAFAAAVKGKQGLVLAYLRQAGVVPPAEKALREKDVPYSVEEYLRRIGAGDAETIKLFLAAGMNPMAEAPGGQNALALAEKNKRAEVKKILEDAGAKFNLYQRLAKMGLEFKPEVFYSEIQKGNLEAVKLFVKGGMPVDSGDGRSYERLPAVIHSGKTAMVLYLIDNGASVNPNFDRRMFRLKRQILYTRLVNMALLEAAYHNREKVLLRLLEKGAFPFGSEVILAVYQGRGDILKYLVSRKRSLREFDLNYAYTLAKKKRSTQMEKALADAGAREISPKKVNVIGFFLKSIAEERIGKKFIRTHRDIMKSMTAFMRKR